MVKEGVLMYENAVSSIIQVAVNVVSQILADG